MTSSGKWINPAAQTTLLNYIAACDEMVVCSAPPANWQSATHQNGWTGSITYTVGQVIYPPTDNGFNYQCTTAGTTGSSAPSWPTTAGNTVTDGTVVWTAVASVGLVNAPMSSGQYVISYDGNGDATLTVTQQIGVITHTTGTVAYTAFLCSADKSVRYYTTAVTTLGGTNQVTAGRTTIIYSMTITLNEPI